MELELQRTCLNGFQMVLDRVVVQEETLESVVPDTCPDMMRIVDADGQVLLTSRELVSGSMKISGSIHISVVYIPDGEEGARHVDVRLPFLCKVDDPAIHSGCKMQVVPRLVGADARAVNPRKLLTRAELAIEVQLYAPDESSVCSGVSCMDEENGVQQRLEEQETYQVRAVQEKGFAYSDVLSLPVSKPRAKELLRAKVEPRSMEAKLIGGKLVLKGEVDLRLLYRCEEDSVASHVFQLPYSQVMDLGEMGEENDINVVCAVSGLDCSLQSGDPSAAAVTLELLVQAVVWERRKVTLLADMYSTRYPLEVERLDFRAQRLVLRETRRESVRQFCECGIPAQTVVDGFVAVGRITWQQGELCIQTEATVLFLSEDGALCSVSYPILVSSKVEGIKEGAKVLCRCAGGRELTVAPVTGGLEVRFELELSLLVLEQNPCPSVGELRVLPVPEGGTAAPSLIVRMAREGETLWEMAKSCNSTIENITSANGLEGESVPAGMLLLIPRSR